MFVMMPVASRWGCRSLTPDGFIIWLGVFDRHPEARRCGTGAQPDRSGRLGRWPQGSYSVTLGPAEGSRTSQIRGSGAVRPGWRRGSTYVSYGPPPTSCPARGPSSRPRTSDGVATGRAGCRRGAQSPLAPAPNESPGSATEDRDMTTRANRLVNQRAHLLREGIARIETSKAPPRLLEMGQHLDSVLTTAGYCRPV